MGISVFSMLFATLAAVIVFAVAIRYRGWPLASALALVALASVTDALRDSPRPRRARATGAAPGGLAQADYVPAQELADGYVSSRACAECHPRQHQTWHASYHRTMTQRATPGAVVGDFADKRVELEGATYVLSRRGDEFWVKSTLPGPAHTAAQVLERPIVLTTGSHHTQVYWVPTGSGRTVAELPIFFLREDQRWISRDGSFLKPRNPDPNAPAIGRWNTQCIQCHATHGRARPSLDPGDISSDSLVAEFGIA